MSGFPSDNQSKAWASLVNHHLRADEIVAEQQSLADRINASIAAGEAYLARLHSGQPTGNLDIKEPA